MYIPDRMRPGVTAPMNSSPTDCWATTANRMARIEGGIRIPRVPPARIEPHALSGL